MSFLRALRAYIGLGPDDEIEDRYLSELNARRRELALEEIRPDGGTRPPVGPHVEHPDAAPVPSDRRRAVDVADQPRRARPAADRPSGGRAARTGGMEARRWAEDWSAGTERDRADDTEDAIDLAFVEGVDEAMSEGARGSVGSGGSRGAVVRSLDSMRAKPRTLMPESFADAKLIADEFKRHIPVVLNLQTVERDLARRLIDFASGICYALDGSMEKLASQVFLLVPDSVEVSEEDRRRIEERGYAR